MKKKFARMLCLVLAMTTLLATGAMAASPTASTGPDVRVNGEIVDFPDGQPYVDENNRTMIPVRFVTEALGAKVGWEGSTQTVTITKDSTTVTIRIGSPELTVTKDGKTSDKSNIVSLTCDLGQTKVTLSNVASSGKVKISWEPVEGATKYQIYRATSKNGTYSRISTTGNTSATNTKTDAGKTYYYKVRAICDVDAAAGAYSEVKSITCDLAQPTVSIALSASSLCRFAKYESSPSSSAIVSNLSSSPSASTRIAIAFVVGLYFL